MHFRGGKLVQILRSQTQDIKVKRSDESVWGYTSPSNAVLMVGEGGYYGVGQRNRIQFIRETRGHQQDRRRAVMDYIQTAMNLTGETLISSTEETGARQ